MKIGIVGYGKMGRDVFRAFFDHIAEAQYVVYDAAGGEEANTEELLKELGKALKRKKLSVDEYERKKTLFRFTSDLNDFAGCNIVFEAVFENLAVKKELFAKLSGIVSPVCVLATNSSSLDIAEIFADVPNKERCLGLHFFYPVKLTGFVELNILPESSPLFFTALHPIVFAMGKRFVTFSGEYHIYLNQILACAVSHAIRLAEEYNVSPAELDKALAGLFPVAAPFEILDTVGLGLMAGSPDNFRIERNKALLAYGCEKMNSWLAEGCPKETGKFLGFAAEKLPDTGNSADGAALSMIAVVLNETAKAADESGQKSTLVEAVRDTLGLEKELPDYYAEYGSEALFAELGRLAEKYGCGTYQPADKSLWDKAFSK